MVCARFHWTPRICAICGVKLSCSLNSNGKNDGGRLRGRGYHTSTISYHIWPRLLLRAVGSEILNTAHRSQRSPEYMRLPRY